MKAEEAVEVDEMGRDELVARLLESKEFRDRFMEKTVRQSIAAQVRALRKQYGLTLHRFAAKAGIGYTTAFRLEHPLIAASISIKTLLKIAVAFDVALIIKFVSFSRWLAEYFVITPEGCELIPFEEDAKRVEEWGRA